jgi:ESS family glutamate:Na+ symporter
MQFALISTAILLAIAVGIRRAVPLLATLFIPASVIAGFVGFALLQFVLRTSQTAQAAELASQWKSWPGFLIAVVFAGMLLQRRSSSASDALSRAGRQGLMVWIIVLGQTAIGLLLTWLIIGPVFGVPDSFGMLIETGFAGGHGTAAAMGEVFASAGTSGDDVKLESGLDLGIMMATIGLVYGIVSGVIWVNVGVRRGWIRKHEAGGVEKVIDQPKTRSIGTAVVEPNLIDPLLLQATWLVLAMAVGGGLQWAVGSVTSQTSASAIIGSFPLFIYTLFGGWIVRKTLATLGSDRLIDSLTITRLTSSAMDILVVAAIASLNITAISGQLAGLSILVVAAALWTAFCLMGLSKWILPKQHWFELGLINYGMSTGTTATGFVLLKLVDPELKSGAAEDYALAAPLSSPFIGGGMITVGLPIVVLGVFPMPLVVTVLAAVIVTLTVIGIKIAKAS